MTENYNNIPAELKSLPQWVVWGVDKTNPKCPYNPSTIKPAKAGDPSTWSTYDRAIICTKSVKTQGIGFEFHNNGIYGVDLDHVLQDGKLTPEADEIVTLLDAYTEISPSGEGLHIFVKADAVELAANRKGFIEIYNKERYFTVTGNVYGELKPIHERTEALWTVYNKYLAPKPVEPQKRPPTPPIPNKAGTAVQKSDEDYLRDGLQHDKTLIAYWNGSRPTGNESADDQGFANKLSYWCNNNETLIRVMFLNSPYCSGKDDKHFKKSAIREDYLTRTIQKAIQDTPMTARQKDEAYKLEQTRKDFCHINHINHVSHLNQAEGKNENSNEWEQPVPFDNITIPPFPIDCLPSPLKEYALAVSESTQTPVDMAAVAALAVMATCVQGKYKVQGKPDWIEPLNLYIAIVANPAERKSAVLDFLTKYIIEYECKHNEEHAEEINRSKLEKTMLIKEINHLTDQLAKGKGDKSILLDKQDELTNFKEIKPLRLFTDDATAEALTSLLATNNGKIAAISSEGGIFEMLLGRYSQGVNIDTFLKAHSGDPIRVDRKGRESEFIKKPCLTVLLSIQPQVLDGLIGNEVFRGRGLTARFLYGIPVSSVGNREFETDAIPSQCKTQYRELCFNLLDIKQEDNAETLRLSKQAYDLSAAFAKELEPRLIDDLEGMADWAGKLHGAVLRIAGILHVVNQLVFAPQTPIPEGTMLDAMMIGYYFLEHARAAYQLMGTNEEIREAKYVLSKIEKERLEKATKTELVRLCRKYKSTEELNDPLKYLVQANYLKEQMQPYSGTGRQPEPVYIVNPLWLSQRD